MPEPLVIMHMGNLFADAEAPLTGERLETILTHQNLVVERIVSSAAAAPMEYMQHHDEWVALLQGEATLEVAGRPIELHSGDYLFCPPTRATLFGVSPTVLSGSPCTCIPRRQVAKMAPNDSFKPILLRNAA